MAFWDDVSKAIKDAVTDASVLEVNTFTGDIKAVVNAAKGGTLLDWDKLLAEAKKAGTVKLAASTKVMIDGDQNQYLSENLSADLHAVHQKAVESGLQLRQSFVKMVKELF